MLMQASRERPTSAHVIVMGNEKGGAGKSTIAMHVAVGLMNFGQRVATRRHRREQNVREEEECEDGEDQATSGFRHAFASPAAPQNLEDNRNDRVRGLCGRAHGGRAGP